MKRDNVVIHSIGELIKRYKEHEIGQVGGQLAYFFVLSIFPFLIFLNAAIGFVNIPKTALIDFLAQLLPVDIVEFITDYINSLNNTTNIKIISIGAIIALFSASKAVFALTYAINRAYDVKQRRGFVKNYILPAVFMLVLVGVIALTIVLGILGKDFIANLNQAAGFEVISAELWNYARWMIVIATLVLVLSGLYYFVPNTGLRFSLILPGTAVALLGWIISVWGFSFYINTYLLKWGIYGTLGALMGLMVWFYFIGIILIIGAELNSIINEYCFAIKRRG